MLQRLYRLKAAPKYLGIDKNVFNRDVRPELSEIRHGRAVLFDRLELDARLELEDHELAKRVQTRGEDIPKSLRRDLSWIKAYVSQLRR